MSVGGRFDIEPLNVGNYTFPWYQPEPTYTPLDYTWISSGLPEAPKNNKLQYIKGLIEGARLSESTDKIDALLDKILEVIGE